MQQIVVLGAGHWHLRLYRDAWVEHHDIVGVWDQSADAAAKAAADLGTTAYLSVVDCLAAGPDLAHVLGVHAQMPGICRQLIAAGIPFVLEKPGAAAVADLAAVRDEAAAAGVPATVGSGGHIAVDTRGGVEINAPGEDTVQESVDVDSDALCPIFVKDVAGTYDSGFAGMPTLTDLVEAMRPIEESYATT